MHQGPPRLAARHHVVRIAAPPAGIFFGTDPIQLVAAVALKDADLDFDQARAPRGREGPRPRRSARPSRGHAAKDCKRSPRRPNPGKPRPRPRPACGRVPRAEYSNALEPGPGRCRCSRHGECSTSTCAVSVALQTKVPFSPAAAGLASRVLGQHRQLTFSSRRIRMRVSLLKYVRPTTSTWCPSLTLSIHCQAGKPDVLARTKEPPCLPPGSRIGPS